MLRINLSRLIVWAASAVLPLALTGCSPSTGFHEVGGVVTHNGEPVPRVFITFHPANPDADPESMAMTDEHGRYQLTVGSTPGVPPGEHTVSATDPASVNGGSTSDDPGYTAVITKYAPGKSTYKVTIDKDETDLELKLD